MSADFGPLEEFFDDCLEQVEHGKGMERHAECEEQDFLDQPMFKIMDLCGSGALGFPCGQAIKKINEAVMLTDRFCDPEAAIAELCGAANYIAAAAIYIKNNYECCCDCCDDCCDECDEEAGNYVSKEEKPVEEKPVAKEDDEVTFTTTTITLDEFLDMMQGKKPARKYKKEKSDD